jgi:capsular polysaccharide transport system ATP-binding protein
VTLVLDHVAKSYRTRGVWTDVLRDVNATFEPGQSVGILGAPKSGKSTLMRIISRETAPSAGRVRRSSCVSFLVGSGGGTDRMLAARDVIAFVARVYGVRTRGIIDFVADFGELREDLGERMSSLSKDKKARLLFTLAYALPFDIYLADEAILGGPQDFQERCAALVHERRKTSGLIFTTSKVQKVRDFANVGAMLHQGELFIFPSVEEAIRAYEMLNPMAHLYNLLPDPEEAEEEPEEVDGGLGLF